MRLGRRPKRKKDQALDVVASAAKTWSEWQLAKRATKGVAKGTKKAASLRGGRSSGLKGAVTGTTAKIVAGVALLGGIGAAMARKLKGGGGDEPVYTPPAPHEPAAMAPAPPPPPPPAPGAAAHEPPPPPLAAAPDPPPTPGPPPAPEPPPAPAPEPEPPAYETFESTPSVEPLKPGDPEAVDEDAGDDEPAGGGSTS